MKKYLALTIGIAAMAFQAFAQKVEVSLTLAHTMFVTGEPVLVQAKVTNLLRGQLDIGDDAPDTFLIEVSKGTRDNELAPEEGKPFIKPLTLMPGNTLSHQMEVDKWFDLSDNGKYLIRAILVHNGMRYESAMKSFDVMPGVPLKKGTQMFVNRPNLERTFQLVHWTRNQTKHLFLRIEDTPSGQVWDTIDLGEFSRTEEPRLDIAPTGEVTTFHRANADSFLRTVVWSLPDSVEVADRDALLDPNVPATKRMRAIYGDVQEAAEKKKSSSWWKFW